MTGQPPAGFSDGVTAYQVDERADGVYVQLPPMRTEVRTVADAMVETLVAHGVTRVFGMVGHSNLGFADALRRAEQRGELTYIGIRHANAAAFAASAYGKLTGRPAACFAIAGPGSTNLLTGLYDAKLDQSPVVTISGQVPSTVLGRGAFQDVDLSAVFKDVSVSTLGRIRTAVRRHRNPGNQPRPARRGDARLVRLRQSGTAVRRTGRRTPVAHPPH